MGACACIKSEKQHRNIRKTEQKTEANIRAVGSSPQNNPTHQPQGRSRLQINLVYADRPQISTNQLRRQQTNPHQGGASQYRVNTVEQVSEVDEISSAISQLQRQRRRQPSMIQEQNQQPQQISQLQLLCRAIRRQDLSEEENAILFFRLLALLESEPEAQGLTKQQIDQLQIRQSNNNDEICPVCQDTIKIHENMMVLPCHHLFHPDCIVPWLQKSSKCPVCRGSASRDN